jgi:hypothetical protein
MAKQSPTALRAAIFNSGQSQISVAKKADIHESRLSKIGHGHVQATEEEKKRLSRVLKTPVPDLFPGSDLAELAS